MRIKHHCLWLIILNQHNRGIIMKHGWQGSLQFYDVNTLNVDRWLYLYVCSFTAVFDIPIFVISSDMFLCWPSIWRDIQSHVRTISIWMFHKTCMFFTRSGLRTTCFWFLKLKKENGARFIVHTTFTYESRFSNIFI